MKEFSPVISNKLYIQIYNQLHHAITSGRFKVGDKLPSEKELCQIFNVSRVPVREALCALELNVIILMYAVSRAYGSLRSVETSV